MENWDNASLLDLFKLYTKPHYFFVFCLPSILTSTNDFAIEIYYMSSTILEFLMSPFKRLPPERVEETFPNIDRCKLNKASHLGFSPSFDWIWISKDFPCNLCLKTEHDLLWNYFLFWFILIFPYKLNIFVLIHYCYVWAFFCYLQLNQNCNTLESSWENLFKIKFWS